MSARTYLFVRHAEATHQSPSRGPGRHFLAFDPASADWPLTTRGEHQARALGAALRSARVSRLVSSTMLRARQTTDLVTGATGLPWDDAWPDLDEISPETLRRSAASRQRPEWLEGVLAAWRVRTYGRHEDRSARQPVAPEILAVERRVRGVLARLDALDEPRVAVVGHGYWILLMALLLPGRFRLRPIANCSITRVDVDVDVTGRQHRLVSFAQPARSLFARAA